MPRSRAAAAAPDLFAAQPALPSGFKYQAEIVSAEEEQELAARFAELPFKPFEFQGYLGNRRVLSFGWHYDFNDRQLREAGDIPPLLLPLRDRCAAFTNIEPAALEHVLLTEYLPGAGIGWHKDKAVFSEVIGVSLLSACTFRFRRRKGAGWERVSVIAEPRSAYLLSGPSRSDWEHSIPAVDSLRYSVTFRNLKSK
jgi:alkylated DNA repair dioxygenase AlkB